MYEIIEENSIEINEIFEYFDNIKLMKDNNKYIINENIDERIYFNENWQVKIGNKYKKVNKNIRDKLDYYKYNVQKYLLSKIPEIEINDSLITLIQKNFKVNNKFTLNIKIDENIDKEYQYIILYIKRYLESLIVENTKIKSIDILIIYFKLYNNILGQTRILEYNGYLPKRAELKINENYKKNINYFQFCGTVLHELIHCLGFGFWERNNNIKMKNFISNTKYINCVDSAIIDNKLVNRYKLLLKIPDLNVNYFPLDYSKSGHLLSNNKCFCEPEIKYIFPSTNLELMSEDEDKINVLTKLTARVLELYDYKLDYSLLDKYPTIEIPQKSLIRYSKISKRNCFYDNEQKNISEIWLESEDKIIYSNIQIYYVIENKKYEIYWDHFPIGILNGIIINKNNICGTKEGIKLEENKLMMEINNYFPKIALLFSCFTNAGIILLKIPEKEYISLKESINNKSPIIFVKNFIK